MVRALGLLVLLSGFVRADVAVLVKDASGRALAGAFVLVDGVRAGETGAGGAIDVASAAKAPLVRVEKPGFVAVERRAVGPLLEVVLEPAGRVSADVTSVAVRAIRAEEALPVTASNLDRGEIAARSYGQEMPTLLERTPGLNAYSETGSVGGYSYFTLRGISQTRVNMTLDGVPLNDPEETAVYFANFGGFTDAVDSIQIQRGVGTSTVGAPSFGGSISFASAAIAEAFSVSGELGTGSFQSHRGTVAIQSGKLGTGLALYGRVSLQETDGSRDHSGVRQQSFYGGLSYTGERSYLKVFGFLGRERTELAYYAVEKSVLEANPRHNDLAPEEHDRFGQDLLHAQYTVALDSGVSLSAQLYYSGAQGKLYLWNDPVAKNYFEESGIDGQAVGLNLAATAKRGDVSFTWGANLSTFSRDHFRDAQGLRLYENTGKKNEASTFVKAAWEKGPWIVYADAQLRFARFRYEGTQPIGATSWTFLNPKLGARRTLTPQLSVYASAGLSSREPARNDLFQGEDDPQVVFDLTAVKPERLVNVELGGDLKRGPVSLHANLYAMEFRNEIAATGEQSELGYAIRRNAPRSFRRGLEVDASASPAAGLRLSLAANVSWNRVSSWTQLYDVYDASGGYAGSEVRVSRNTEPLLTPPVLLQGTVDYAPVAPVSVSLSGRWVASSWLDNTNQQGLETPSFFRLDGSLQVDLSSFVPRAKPRLRVSAVNLLNDRRIWPSGYSYLFLNQDASGAKQLSGSAYFYPQAGRSAFVSLGFAIE